MCLIICRRIRFGLRRLIPAHLADTLSPEYISSLLYGSKNVDISKLKANVLYESMLYFIEQFLHI